MDEKENAVSAWLAGDTAMAKATAQEWAGGAQGGAGTEKDQILAAWLQGDLVGAEQLSRDWVKKEPRELMPLLVLGETHLRVRNLPAVLGTLEQAQQVDSDHPMYYRLVCLAAQAAGAFTAAHGAIHLAWLTSLPEPILADLQARAVYREKDGEIGAYPAMENTDGRWLHLLVPSWFPEKPPVRLAWDEVDGQIWIYNQGLLDIAVAASTGQGEPRWDDYPDAARIVDQRLRALAGRPPDTCRVEPWMCASWQGYYLPCALRQYGFHPRFCSSPADTGSEVARVTTPAGSIEGGLASGTLPVVGAEAWTKADGVAAVDYAARLLPSTFNGRISLTGPDHRISIAFHWLTSGLPQEAWSQIGRS